MHLNPSQTIEQRAENLLNSGRQVVNRVNPLWKPSVETHSFLPIIKQLFLSQLRIFYGDQIDRVQG